MPDKKLTDNEIIKALKEVIEKGYITYSWVDKTNGNVKILEWADIIDLINRQKADLIDKEKQLQKALKSMAANKTKVIDCKREIDCQKSEIERLNKTLVFEINSAFERGKAEAYKEFAERLKETKFKHGNDFIVYADNIDNLLKELVGEQPILSDVKCIDCEYLELELPYAVCSKAYKGIVQPNDSCGKGKLKELVGAIDERNSKG